MKSRPVVLAVLLVLASVQRLWAQGNDGAELQQLRDQAARALDEAAAANETARLLQAKVEQQAGQIASLQSQLDEINWAAQARVEAKVVAKAVAEKAAGQKVADEKWAAGAPERARRAAQLQAAVDQWRAAIKRTPSMIILPNQATGGASVSIDGKVTQFNSLAEANAFAAAVKQQVLATDAVKVAPAIKP